MLLGTSDLMNVALQIFVEDIPRNCKYMGIYVHRTLEQRHVVSARASCACCFAVSNFLQFPLQLIVSLCSDTVDYVTMLIIY